MLNLIDQKQEELRNAGGRGNPARIFTFSMTDDADDRIPKMIACRNNGSWSPISGKYEDLRFYKEKCNDGALEICTVSS